MTDEPTATGPRPHLLDTRTPVDAVGVVLVLHGGGGRGTVPVSPTQLSVLRMVPIAKRAARIGHGRLAVLRLLNAVRGIGRDPLSNVCWALAEVRERFPDRPIALLGHSLGATVALSAAAEADVRGVIALAPWLSGSETASRLTGTPTLIVHGDQDRVSNPAAAQRLAADARRRGAPTSYVAVRGGEHTMLRHMRTFDLLAAHYARAVLDPQAQPGRSGIAELAWRARDEPGEYPPRRFRQAAAADRRAGQRRTGRRARRSGRARCGS